MILESTSVIAPEPHPLCMQSKGYSRNAKYEPWYPERPKYNLLASKLASVKGGQIAAELIPGNHRATGFQ